MKRLIMLLGMMVFIFMAMPVYGQVIVTISPEDPADPTNRNIKVVPEVVTLEYGSSDPANSITFITEGFEDPDICFYVIFAKHGTPFGGANIGNCGNLNNNTGPPVVPPGQGQARRYDYLVVVPRYAPLDPAVIIWQ